MQKKETNLEISEIKLNIFLHAIVEKDVTTNLFELYFAGFFFQYSARNKYFIKNNLGQLCYIAVEGLSTL